LIEKDYETANKEKHIVEEREREIRKERKEKGEIWKPVLFELDEKKNWILKESKLPKSEEIVHDLGDDKSWGGYLKSFFY